MPDRKSEPRKRTKSDGTSERTPPLSKAKSIRSFLNVNPETQFEIVRGLAGFERRYEIAIISSS